MFDPHLIAQLTVLVTVVLIDIVLAGDNAVVVGTAAADLPAAQQRRVIMIGAALALVARIGFALVATQLLAIIGLLFAGGLLLLWVAWKIWRDLRAHQDAAAASAAAAAKPKTIRSAIVQVAVADISMSLDNVLAIAGAAREHPYILVFGLVLSVALMGLAATFVARLLNRHRWIAWVGLFVILYVALKMVYEGWLDVAGQMPH